MTTTLVCACGRPSRLPLCRACAVDLDRLLARVPDLYADLDITLTRQDRVVTGGGGGGRRTEQPLPLNLVAAEARAVLAATITAWGEALVDLGVAARRWDAQDVRDHLGELRGLPDAGDALTEITHAVALAVRAIDLRRETSWIGECGALVVGEDGVATCTASLFASITEDATVTCPACRAVSCVADRRAVLLDVARDRLLPAADLARFARAFGVKVDRHVVRYLVTRDRLTPVGTHADGRPTYRVGDLLDHLTRRRTA